MASLLNLRRVYLLKMPTPVRVVIFIVIISKDSYEVCRHKGGKRCVSDALQEAHFMPAKTVTYERYMFNICLQEVNGTICKQLRDLITLC